MRWVSVWHYGDISTDQIISGCVWSKVRSVCLATGQNLRLSSFGVVCSWSRVVFNISGRVQRISVNGRFESHVSLVDSEWLHRFQRSWLSVRRLVVDWARLCLPLCWIRRFKDFAQVILHLLFDRARNWIRWNLLLYYSVPCLFRHFYWIIILRSNLMLSFDVKKIVVSHLFGGWHDHWLFCEIGS